MTNHPNRGRGRPPLAVGARKVSQTISLSPDVLAALKAKGRGWMPATDDLLRRALEDEGAL
jgi:uncharacterized protein (DUF4415 family)